MVVLAMWLARLKVASKVQGRVKYAESLKLSYPR